MVAPLPSELAPNPEDAVSAVAALGFFFVMLWELRNTNVFTFACLFLVPRYFHRGATPVGPAAVFRGANGGVGQVRDYGMDTGTKKSTTLNEFHTPSLHAMNHEKVAPMHNPAVVA